MLNGGTGSRERDVLSVITQPLRKLNLHTDNFMQIKTDTTEKKHTTENTYKLNIEWKIIDEQHCVYIKQSCGIYAN